MTLLLTSGLSLGLKNDMVKCPVINMFDFDMKHGCVKAKVWPFWCELFGLPAGLKEVLCS